MPIKKIAGMAAEIMSKAVYSASRSIELIRKDGLVAFAKKVFEVLKSMVFQYKLELIFELKLEDFVPISSKIELVHRKATWDDIEALLAAGDYSIDYDDTEYIKERLSKGGETYLAVHNGKIAGYNWIMKGEMELSPRKLMKISPDRCYLYNGFVRDEYRGQRVINSVHTFIVKDLMEHNFKGLITTINSKNESSLKTGERTGFRKVGSIHQFKVLGFGFNFIPQKDRAFLQK